jgi:predicted nucleotidyltransferase
MAQKPHIKRHHDMSADTDILIQRAAAALKTAGAREIYVFGSAAHGTDAPASDLDLAVSGLPPSVFYRMGARVSDLIGRSVDLIDLDRNTPFTRHLRTENELVRVG